MMGQYDRALRLAERALAETSTRAGPDSPAVASSLRLLAVIQLSRGDYHAAEPPLERARVILERAVVAHDDDYNSELCAVLNDLAELYHQTGEFRRAEPLFARARAILTESFGPNDPRLAAVLDNEGSLSQDEGDYARAEANYLQSIAIRERAPAVEADRIATSLANLATLYQSRGDWDRAQSLYERAIERFRAVVGPDHPSLATLTFDFASLQAARGNSAQARQLYQQVLAAFEKTLGEQHPQVARVQSALGELYDAQGDFAAAEPLLRRACETLERTLGTQHPALAAALMNLASVLSGQGDFVAAEALLSRSLAIHETALGGEHPRVADSLSALAELEAWQGRDERAIDLLSKAEEVRERSTIQVLSTGSEAQKRAFLALSSGEGVAAVALALRSPSEPAARLALTSVLRRKSRALDVMADTLRTVRRQLDPEGAQQLQELLALRSKLAASSLLGPGPTGAKAQRRELEQLSAKEHQLEVALSAKSAAYRAGLGAITLESVQAAIPEGSALVEWTYYQAIPPASARTNPVQARIAAAILRRTGSPRWIDLGDAAALSERVRAARQAFASDSGDPRIAARALEASAFAPIRAQLGATRSVLLAPDGVLSLVPFAALVDDEQHYLLERWEFSYLTSGRDLLRLDDQRLPRTRAVVVGNPEFGPPRPREPAPALALPTTDHEPVSDWLESRVFNALPRTAEEARQVGAVLAPASLLLGKAATEAAVKAQRGPSILHIATHGFFLPEAAPAPGTEPQASGSPFPRPQRAAMFSANASLLRSGIALAGANSAQSGEDDGILTALEVSALDLDGTQLVVLSACETGLGDPTVGEGVNGLRRALVLAGSSAQVMSLWNIRDESTRELMADFYGRLRRGETRAAALRSAQLAFLSRADRAHPNYWAAFMLSGRPDQIRALPAPALGQAPATRAGCQCTLASRSSSTASGLPGSFPALLAACSAALVAATRRRSRPRRGRGRIGPSKGGSQREVGLDRSRFALALTLLVLSFALPGCPPPGAGLPGASADFPEGAWLTGGSTRAPATRMPTLPWPPARWTAMMDLGEVRGPLGAQFLRIARMLKRASLEDGGVFAIDNDGFAVVTRIESITDTGEPRHDPGRFSYDEAGRIQGGRFFDVLFNRKPGRYRSFTILVTPLDLTRGPSPTWGQRRDHYSEGQAHLPSSLANRRASPGTRMTVLIYEFVRPTPDDAAPFFVPRSNIATSSHLVRSGLLSRSGAP